VPSGRQVPDHRSSFSTNNPKQKDKSLSVSRSAASISLDSLVFFFFRQDSRFSILDRANSRSALKTHPPRVRAPARNGAFRDMGKWKWKLPISIGITYLE
jgi:hypothetical protein